MKHLLSILLLSTLSFSLPSIECKAKTVVNKTPTETPANEGEEETGYCICNKSVGGSNAWDNQAGTAGIFSKEWRDIHKERKEVHAEITK